MPASWRSAELHLVLCNVPPGQAQLTASSTANTPMLTLPVRRIMPVWTHQIGNLSALPDVPVIAEQPDSYNGSFNPHQVTCFWQVQRELRHLVLASSCKQLAWEPAGRVQLNGLHARGSLLTA